MNKEAFLTIFTIPKPFEEHIDVIQRNAIESWLALSKDHAVNVVLGGGEAGSECVANSFGLNYLPDIQTNEFGTPLLDDYFEQVQRTSNSQYYCFANSDIIFTPKLIQGLNFIDQEIAGDFLAIGQRTDLDIKHRIDSRNSAQLTNLIERASVQGKKAAIVCKDYFVFRKGCYRQIPSFAVGRGNWDNWMVAHAHANDFPVIDVSDVVIAIHQNHDYSHVDGGRLACYATGVEAKRNAVLAGGRNLVNGSKSTQKLVQHQGQYHVKSLRYNRFWLDLPRFAKLLSGLVKYRS